MLKNKGQCKLNISSKWVSVRKSLKHLTRIVRGQTKSKLEQKVS